MVDEPEHADTNQNADPNEISARRWAAAVSGAIEGFVEGMERSDLRTEAQHAAEQAGDLARATASTPEAQQLGHAAQRATHTTTERAHQAADNMRDRVLHAKQTAQRLTDDAREKSHAIAETTRRAKTAPRQIARELSAGAKAWTKGVVRTIGLMTAMAVLATVAFIVLTIALVAWLNGLIGDPAGTFVVALAYTIIAATAWASAKAAKTNAKNETQRHINDAKREVQHVTTPVKTAFRRGRGM